ncbi:uncharacterized protein lcorl isoform X2 [Esox lucius]|uniref:uncharacterized protein lcorl isoform X2 n=1 Tax=Esox lucius TaxID=8010 RepID=UPI001476C3BF|nr:uncharacterized protein lcorl isoform X2 [Esox lucius]
MPGAKHLFCVPSEKRHLHGFESILEGVYGPFLLRDLNTFNDCEPEEMDDWSLEATCSFCNLLISDHVPVATSPSDDMPSQAPPLSESSLSAHRFLHSVFQEKELEVSGDANIPQVAQELMRRMVTQFAIEYASKTHLTTSSTTGSQRSDLETPLDLTVTRNQENQEEPVDGVLDLSRRNPASSATSSPISQASGSPLAAVMDEPQSEAEDSGTSRSPRWRGSALQAVLSSYCPVHRALFQRVLRFAHQQHHLSLAYRDAHRRSVLPPDPLCCHLVAKQLDDATSPHPPAFPFTECQSRGATGAPCGVSGCCCVQRCRLPAVCFCLNSLHCLSCQSLGRVSTAVCPSMASSLCPLTSVCCSHPNPRLCATSCCPEHTSLALLTNTTPGGGRECPVLKRERSRSPSPPPLSPIPSDMQQEEDRPPCLQHHQEEEDEEEEECTSDTAGEGQLEEGGSSIGLQDLVERFSEKLKTIRPHEKDPSLNSALVNHNLEKANQSVAESQTDTHLSEIITTVLRTGSGNDYSLNDMLHRHDKNENQSPQTRSRRRQEARAAMKTSPDQPSTRRHTVLVKRDLARLDESLGRKRLAPGRSNSRTATPPSEPNPVSAELTSVTEEEAKGEVAEREAVVEVAEREAVVEVVEEKVDGVVVKEGASEEAKGEEEARRVSREEAETVRVTEDREVKEEMKEELPIKSSDTSVTHLNGWDMSCQDSSWSALPVRRRGKRRETEEEERRETLPFSHYTSNVSDRIIPPQPSGRARRSRPPAQPGESRDVGNSREAENRPSEEGGSRSVEEVGRLREEAGRSRRRKIIPPQRFSSYVTEPRKMYFAACFSESIFSAQRTPKDLVLPQTMPTTSHTASTSDTANKLATTNTNESLLGSSPEVVSREKGRHCRPTARGQSSHSQSQKRGQVSAITAASSKNRRDVMECAARPYGRLRSSPVKPSGPDSHSQPESHQAASRPEGEVHTEQPSEPRLRHKCTSPEPRSRCQPQYTSPIKLMFVSAVVGEDGVRYTLKAAASGARWQGETFDPCEESSWAGTPEKSLEKAYSPHENCTPKTSPKSSSVKSSTNCPPSNCTSKSNNSPKIDSPLKTTGPPKTKSPFKTKSPPKTNASHKTNSPLKKKSPLKTRSPLKDGLSSSPRPCVSRGEGGSPPKNSPGSLNGDAPPLFHETTPPKRRPGRPKKLGPQLEKKAKRPIGRPPKQRDVDQSGGSRKGGQDLVGGSGCSSEDWIGLARPGCEETNPPNRNLKITVVYGRSRRTQRTVSEEAVRLLATRQQGDVQYQHRDMCLDRNHRAHPEKKSPPATIQEPMEDLILPVKERKFNSHAPHTSRSNIKYQKLKCASAMRRPGRPAKVKISGISVTVTTVSPRQRKIHMNRTDGARKSIETLRRRKALLSETQLSKEPVTISAPLSENVTCAQTHGTEESKDPEVKPQDQTHPPLAVRHSVRVRKPSVYLLHSVATSSSRSRSHSTALLRRSRQLLLNKASSEGCQRRKLEEAAAQEGRHTLGPKVLPSGREDGSEGRGVLCEDLKQVAEVSVESIFLPSDSEALRWWPVSSDQDSLKEELARRIKLMSHSWVSTTVPHTTRSGSSQFAKQRLNGCISSWMPSEGSAVRLLFDRCCSVERLASWFMQTTETQSLGIVKKASSRNPYELLHYPCAASRGSVCPSPQAERLRKHVKKFAKAVPKSPAQLRLAQKSFRHGKLNAKRRLFTPRLMPGPPHHRAPWRTGRALGAYITTLLRVKDKFLPRSARMNRANQLQYSQAVWRRRRQVAAAGSLLGQVRPSAQTRTELTGPPVHHHHPPALTSPAPLTDQQVGAIKQQRLRSKAWSPERLQECRVFLKKINSPDTESIAEEEWGVCTVKLDETYCPDGTRQEEEDQAGKMGRRKKRRTRKVLLEDSGCFEQQETVIQEQDRAGNRRGKRKSPGNTTSQSSPPPKVIRQSRGRGLTGPRWQDFILGT